MRDLLQAELDALLDAIDESDPQLLEAARAVALWARRRSARFGGPASVTVADVQTVLALWAEEFGPLKPGPHDLGFHEASLFALLGFRFVGTDRNGRQRYDRIVHAVLRGDVSVPPTALRRGERPWRFVMPEVAQRICELVVLLGMRAEREAATCLH